MKNILFMIMIAFFLPSCMNPETEQMTLGDEVQIDTAQGSCPLLTEDTKGNTVLSWVKKIDAGKSVFCYAVSTDEGNSFGKTISIPGSENVHPHGENLPKIIFKPSGEIIAAWPCANPNPKNDYSDLVYYSQSFDNGNTWSERQKLVKDSASYDQRYFDMALLPDGEAAIIWLDNRKKDNANGSGLFYAATNGNSGFVNERIIGGPCCECCRTDLFIDNKKNIHVLYRAIINDSIRDMVHSISTDNGKSFSDPVRISKDNWVINGCPHTGPAMAESKDGIQFSWFTGGGDAGIYFCKSNDNGKTFSEREMISGSSSKHCQIISLNDRTAIVWNESFPAKNNSSSRIGIALGNEKDDTFSKQYITSENGEASFPVIKSIDKKRILVAYTDTKENRDYIKYKVVNL